jgi:hypothetical protein
MPRKPWVPLPHEADRFCNVYIDESSQTKFRYLVIGGLLVPLDFYEAFEADLIAARIDGKVPLTYPDGNVRVLKWEKVSRGTINACINMIETYYSFLKRHNVPTRKHVDFNCIVVDTTKKPLRDDGDGDIEIGFNKQVYFLCAVMLAKRFKTELFHIYPDRRTSPYRLSEAQAIMNAGVKKYGDKREFPIRRLRYHDPEVCQSLQLVDILIGALAYKLNGHYDQPKPNEAKKALCDFVLTRAKIKDPLQNTPYWQRRFMIMHRPLTKAGQVR